MSTVSGTCTPSSTTSTAANEQYIKVARYFAEDGSFLKAIAVWKKVLRNDPSLLEGIVALGDLYARQGLVAEAKQTFSIIVDEYARRNQTREAEEVRNRITQLDLLGRGVPPQRVPSDREVGPICEDFTPDPAVLRILPRRRLRHSPRVSPSRAPGPRPHHRHGRPDERVRHGRH